MPTLLDNEADGEVLTSALPLFDDPINNDFELRERMLDVGARVESGGTPDRMDSNNYKIPGNANSNLLLSKERSSKHSSRYQWVDVLKGLAAVVIMLHHITLYSPFTDLADEFAGSITIPLYNHGPLAVQVFMVLGGFALAIALPSELNWQTLCNCFMARYFRIVAPYVVTLILLVLAWATVGRQMSHPMIEQFSFMQLAAHLVFLQDVLGYGNLSAGTWYLCIDIQYVGLTLLVLFFASFLSQKISSCVSATQLAAIVMASLGSISAWHWNLRSENESLVIYFLATLVLGTLLGWTAKRRCSALIVSLYVMSLVASQSLEFRLRLCVGLITGIFLLLNVVSSVQTKVPSGLLWLGRISYSLFLIHYLVSSLVMHYFEAWVGESCGLAIVAMVAAATVSIGSAWLLNVLVEQPVQRLVRTWFKDKVNPSGSVDLRVQT